MSDDLKGKSWIRKLSLVVAKDNGEALELSNLRVQFVTSPSNIETPNPCEVTIYNASNQTEKKLKSKEYTRLIISAGYEYGLFGKIFEGTIKQVRLGRENQVDTYIAIAAGAGDHGYNFGIVNTSIAAGATTKDQVNTVVKDGFSPYGLSLGYMADNIRPNPLPRGKVMFGMAKDVMRDLARTHFCNWYIDQDQVHMLPIDAHLPTSQAIVLNEASGMIGIPQLTPAGVVVKCLLNPEIRINRIIHLNNPSINEMPIGLGIADIPQNELILQGKVDYHLNRDGFYCVYRYTHRGDTRGQSWYTEITAIAIDSSSINPDNLKFWGAAGANAPGASY